MKASYRDDHMIEMDFLMPLTAMRHRPPQLTEIDHRENTPIDLSSGALNEPLTSRCSFSPGDPLTLNPGDMKKYFDEFNRGMPSTPEPANRSNHAKKSSARDRAKKFFPSGPVDALLLRADVAIATSTQLVRAVRSEPVSERDEERCMALEHLQESVAANKYRVEQSLFKENVGQPSQANQLLLEHGSTVLLKKALYYATVMHSEKTIAPPATTTQPTKTAAWQRLCRPLSGCFDWMRGSSSAQSDAT